MGIVGMMLAMVNMLFDYAKIMVVVNDYYAMFKVIKEAMMFVMMSLRKTTGLYGLYLLTAIIILIIYLVGESMLHVNSLVLVIIFFIWSQLYLISKIWIRLSFFSGQYLFYKHSNTAMPGMSKEMLEEAVVNYQKRIEKTS
jgi:hypothetical protein